MPPAKTKILFVTNCELGQANVHITVASTLLQQYPGQVDAHLCSFKNLAPQSPEGVTFHALKGTSQADIIKRDFAHLNPGLRTNKSVPWCHRPTLISQLTAVFLWRNSITPWTEVEYLDLAKQVEDLITTLQPDLVVLDPLCGFASDAVYRLGARAMTLSPVSWNASARGTLGEENKDWALKWPSICSANPFPLPWYLVPLNIFHMLFVTLWLLFLSPGYRRLNKARVKAGYHWMNPLTRTPSPIICPGTMALDFPGNPSPRVIPVGPILRAYEPLQSVDPELYAWLAQSCNDGRHGKGKTILINLGSHFKLDQREVREMMAALKVVLEKRQDLQVLWKLIPDPHNAGAAEDLERLNRQLGGRLRVAGWLQVDPPALLETGFVGVLVHHGGGNSYHEALGNGVPHVVLASWADCYDYAQRVRELGIGEWGNEKDAPSIAGPAVQNALFKALGNSPSDPLALQYAANAARAVPTSRDADSMPLVPMSMALKADGKLMVMTKDNGEELDVVKVARRVASQADQGKDGGEEKAQVHGREVAAEYILRWAQGDTPTVW